MHTTFLLTLLSASLIGVAFGQESDIELDDDGSQGLEELGEAIESESAEEIEETAELPEMNETQETPEPEQVGSPEPERTGPRLRSHRSLENRRATAEEKLFGAYRVHLGAARPTFEKESEYDAVYGSTPYFPTFGVDYFFFDWYATLGLTFRAGFYKDDGHAVTQNGDNYEKDDDGPVELTLMPLLAGLTFQLTPFTQKWFVLSGWGGLEYLYFQEVRVEESDSSSSDSSNSSSSSDSSSDDDKPFVNSGNRKGISLGAAAHFRITDLDGQASGSLSTMGLRGIYLSPFFEMVSGMGDALNFARTQYGLAFTFESI